MGQESDRLAPLVLDAGVLIAFERGSEYARALVAEALSAGTALVVPSGALAQAWRSRRQARLARLLQRCTPYSLDEPRARACGELLASTGGSDVVDAQVALCAAELEAGIVTGDPEDLRALAPGADIREL